MPTARASWGGGLASKTHHFAGTPVNPPEKSPPIRTPWAPAAPALAAAALAAAASAGAAGAHGVLIGGDFSGGLTGVPAKWCVLLAKPPPQEARAVGIVPGAHAPPARPLHLEHAESPLAALYEHEIIQYGDDLA